MSVILGFGLASLFRKACKDRNCLIFKAPDQKEIDKKTYEFDGQCYQFKPKVKRCDVTKKDFRLLIDFALYVGGNPLYITYMNSDTTNISELPVQPGTTGGEAQNIVMTTTEQQSTTYSPNVPGLNNSSASASAGPPAPQNGQGAVQGQAPQPQMQQSQSQPQMSKEMMSQFTGELKNANQNNLTQLPTRDVPMNPLLHVQDDQSKPNHVPQQASAPDYIKEFNNIENTIKQNTPNAQENHFMDNIYEEIQTPLLILFYSF